MQQLRRAVTVAVGVLSIPLLVVCESAEDGTGSGASSAGGAGASTSSGTAGSGAGTIVTCDPPCESGTFCSVAGVCIGDGTCLGDGDCSDGTVCDVDTKSCVPGGGCDAQEVTIEYVPPNMLISLDRSCSMTGNVNGDTKWEIAVSAITTLTTNFASKLRFGLALFPDKVNPNCQQDATSVPVGDANEAAIQTLLADALVNGNLYYPNGPCVTNIDTAMQQAAAEPAFLDPDRASFVLLITDGKQAGCNAAGGDSGTTQIIGDLYQTSGVPTFVVGFGSGVDPAQLDIFAVAGGVPNPDPAADFYPAEDQASLDAALDQIASATLSCTFVLESTPDDPSKIYVFFDNDPTPIAKDPSHQNGWDYDPASNTITFYGATCDLLKDGQVADVDVVLGCAEPTPT